MKKLSLCIVSLSGLVCSLASAGNLDRTKVDATLTATLPASPVISCTCPAGETYNTSGTKSFCQKTVVATAPTEIPCPAGTFNTAKYGGTGDQCIKDNQKPVPALPDPHTPAALVVLPYGTPEGYPAAPTLTADLVPTPPATTLTFEQRYQNTNIDKANAALTSAFNAAKAAVDKRNKDARATIDATNKAAKTVYDAAVKAEAKRQADGLAAQNKAIADNTATFNADVRNATTAKCPAGMTQNKISGAADTCNIPEHLEYDKVLSCTSTSVVAVKITF